jgi:hypothetical protein
MYLILIANKTNKKVGKREINNPQNRRFWYFCGTVLDSPKALAEIAVNSFNRSVALKRDS